jgi:proline dehydrogenase
VAIASGAALTATFLALHHRPTTHADGLATFNNHHLHPDLLKETSPSLATHIRTYAVYSMCSIPFLVDLAPDVLSVLRSVPGVRQVTDLFIRATFFSQVRAVPSASHSSHDVIVLQFVGGDTAQQTIPVLHSLRAENKGTLLAYSVEHDGSGSSSSNSRRIVDEIIQCIDVAAGFENGYAKTVNLRRTWVAVKMVS